jgi:hypothetical protein
MLTRRYAQRFILFTRDAARFINLKRVVTAGLGQQVFAGTGSPQMLVFAAASHVIWKQRSSTCILPCTDSRYREFKCVPLKKSSTQMKKQARAFTYQTDRSQTGKDHATIGTNWSYEW